MKYKTIIITSFITSIATNIVIAHPLFLIILIYIFFWYLIYKNRKEISDSCNDSFERKGCYISSIFLPFIIYPVFMSDDVEYFFNKLFSNVKFQSPVKFVEKKVDKDA
jgi:hypothetical protein